MLWGYFKKVVVADRLAIFVNGVYNNVYGINGLPLIIATIFFAFQIYCDFSGYSDIAIGSAQTMGFNLMDNFKRPYFSKSISEFWKRWHISLSSWFKDYLYIPLGGNRVSKARHYFNIFVTFLISGFWHGANWTFLVWGSLHGFYQIFGLISKNARCKFKELIKLNRFSAIDKYVKIIVTFILVDFGWIFFRANKLSDVIYIIKNLFNGVFQQISNLETFKNAITGFGFNKREFLIAIMVVLVMECVHMIQRHGSIRHMLKNKPIWVRWAFYYGMIFLILFFGVYGQNKFIYFQF